MPMLRRSLGIGIAAVVLWVLVAGQMPGCAPESSNFFDEPRVTLSDANATPDTTISPVLEAPIAPDGTVIWCGTFQLAWNELADLAGGAVKLRDPAPPAAGLLNHRDVDASDFDPDSYVAAAGYTRDGIYARIRKQMDDKFHGEHTPNLPSDSLFSPVTIYAYAFLYKKLDFATPFERFNDPLTFQRKKVAAFGLDPTQQANVPMAGQISILDYRDENDFVVELKTKEPGDRLILAKVLPGSTLLETFDAVTKRIAVAAPIAARADDILEVPKIAFDASHSFNELVSCELISTTPKIDKGSMILGAAQNIKFQMNERGVKLQSEAHISVGCSAAPVRMPAHVMVFDKPFLIVMRRANSKRPYFAAWIGNSRLMVGS